MILYVTMYSKTCTYRNVLGTKFYSGLDRFRFGQGFCFPRGANNGTLYTIDMRVIIQGASSVRLHIMSAIIELIYYKTIF